MWSSGWVSAVPNRAGEWYDIEHFVEGSELAADIVTVVGRLRPKDTESWVLELPLAKGPVEFTRGEWERMTPPAGPFTGTIRFPLSTRPGSIELGRAEMTGILELWERLETH